MVSVVIVAIVVIGLVIAIALVTGASLLQERDSASLLAHLRKSLNEHERELSELRASFLVIPKRSSLTHDLELERRRVDTLIEIEAEKSRVAIAGLHRRVERLEIALMSTPERPLSKGDPE